MPAPCPSGCRTAHAASALPAARPSPCCAAGTTAAAVGRSSVPAAHQIPQCYPTMARANPYVSAPTATAHTSRLHPAVPGASESPSARSASQEAAQLGAQGRSGAAGQHLGPVTLLRARWAWRQDPPHLALGFPAVHRGRTPHTVAAPTRSDGGCRTASPGAPWPALLWVSCLLLPCTCPPAGNVLRGGFFSGELWLLLGPGQSLPPGPGLTRCKQPSHDSGCPGAARAVPCRARELGPGAPLPSLSPPPDGF